MENTHIGGIINEINETLEELGRFLREAEEAAEHEKERKRRMFKAMLDSGVFRDFESPVLEWQIPEERKISEE
jgi:dynactin complex subunit